MDEKNTVEIDMNKPCTKCGQMGATGAGVCLECVSASLADNGQGLIDEALISSWKQMKQLMTIHTAAIKEAYLSSDDGKLSVGLSVELTPSEEIANSIRVKVKINFVESRIKDESMERVSFQQKLPI
jgi:hypothetical protein